MPELSKQQRYSLKRNKTESAKKLHEYNELLADEKLMGFPSYRERLAEEAAVEAARE